MTFDGFDLLNDNIIQLFITLSNTRECIDTINNKYNIIVFFFFKHYDNILIFTLYIYIRILFPSQ